MGNDIFIGFRSIIYNAVIKNRVQIASLALIGKLNKKPVIVENDVWIGTEAVIEPGVTVHQGAVVGARTHVTKDVPPFSIVRPPQETTYARKVKNDRYVNFREMLKKMTISKNSGSYLHKDQFGNFNSAIVVGKFSSIGNGNILIGSSLTGGGIFLDSGVELKNNCILEAAGGIKIGKNTILGNTVHIISNSHDHHFLSLPMTKAPVKIGANVTIGNNVLIMPGITISGGQNIDDGEIILKDI